MRKRRFNTIAITIPGHGSTKLATTLTIISRCYRKSETRRRSPLHFDTGTEAGHEASSSTFVGLEACAYDPVSKSFLINNDGTSANPTGELDVITGSSVAMGNLLLANPFRSEMWTDGNGLGPNNDVPH